MNIFKKIILTCILWAVALTNAQDAVHNYGNIQIHGSAMVGFHMDVINDGTFDKNLGLVSFYNEDQPIIISGAFPLVFNDMEITVDKGLFLETSIAVTNNSNFIIGSVYTPRNKTDIHMNYRVNSFYSGESDVNHIDGYSQIKNEDYFTFPVGDDNRLRPLSIESTMINTNAKCAYFYEDPNEPTTFNTSFNTDIRGAGILGVSIEEFWKLEGSVSSKATLTWDEKSNVILLGDTPKDLKVVGWSKTEEQWVNLGNSKVDGDLNSGSITSDDFFPNDYEIITLGGNNDLFETFSTLELDNYFLSPNGDGKNDFLVIEGLNLSPNNSIQIFNRYGVMVYYKANYNNEFGGNANRNLVFKRNSGLSSGIYFYILTLKDIKQKHQGYLYITE
ncbi:gliding motility-associated C-terminal domain-containing protein [Sediminicola arcticus]|jgi:gliding motility-associated-like protein|uniref:Gliding motility-associated C-terminal domain-containing protein n=1 Tax=Sediminicola arcticus TaxID=1574308 RepID=A0ABV2SWT6_9FLAO